MPTTGKPRIVNVFNVQLQFDADNIGNADDQARYMIETVNELLQGNSGLVRGAQLIAPGDEIRAEFEAKEDDDA